MLLEGDSRRHTPAERETSRRAAAQRGVMGMRHTFHCVEAHDRIPRHLRMFMVTLQTHT